MSSHYLLTPWFLILDVIKFEDSSFLMSQFCLTAFQICSAFVFWQFDYNVAQCGSLSLSHLEFVEFLGVIDLCLLSNFGHLWLLFLQFFSLLSFPSEIFLMYMLVCLMLSHQFLRLCSLLFLRLDYCSCPSFFQFVDSSPCSDQLLNSSDEFISVTVLFSSKIYLWFLFIIL